MTEPPAAQFRGSFPRADVPLDPPLPEVAFLGRSNVGKSSLLNALVGRRIAKISGTPGKTRMLNVFLAALGRPCYLLDLPGYGYAKASKADRAAFRRLVTGTVQRPGLAGVVWLLDIRHEPSEGDGAIQEVFAERGTRVLAAFTKGDKLPRGRRLRRERELREALALDEDQTILTSAKTGDGIAELKEAIGGLLAGGKGGTAASR